MMREAISVVCVIGSITALALVVACRDANVRLVRAQISVADALTGDTTGFARATRPGSIRLPMDHAAHPDYKTEWWYFTGNLSTESGREFGYQFTIFRTALVAPQGARTDHASRWRADQLYTAHMAVSDPEGGRFLFADRNSREALRLAGTESTPFRVWTEGWEIRQVGSDPLEAAIESDGGNFAVALTLQPTRPPILHGDGGLSPKSRDGSNASYYYSYPRLATTGSVRIESERFDVTGMTWMDHEWSTSALSETQVGWDWFALRLSTGHDLMYFQVRERDPTREPFVEATLVSPAGQSEQLPAEDIVLTVMDTWTSSGSGAAYPSSWTLEVPQRAIRLEIVPLMADQELRLAVQYWEGAVTIAGTVAGNAVTGRGYVELTGYSDAAFGQR